MNLTNTTKKLKQERDIGKDDCVHVLCFGYLGHDVCLCITLSEILFSIYRWYCHFDDDVYVNVPVLMRTLRVHKDKVYLGHWPSKLRGWTKLTVIQHSVPITAYK